MDEKRLYELRDYIIKFQPHCDTYLSKLCNPYGKTVLIVGCGWGTELLWCIRKNAKHVTGLDISPRSLDPLHAAIQLLGIKSDTQYSIVQKSIQDAFDIVNSEITKFDLILSNNVFEHLPDINKALFVCSQLVKPNQGRIAIFTDPLYYSSCGSHLPLKPWEHLWESENVIKTKVSPSQWLEYKNGLNKMTVSDFVQAIVKNRLVIHKFETILDRNFNNLSIYKDRILANCSVSETDLSVEGISCELSICSNTISVRSSFE